MNALVGKILTKVELASDKKALRFTTEDGLVIARCEGDCCSETWVEAIEMPALGLPATVISAEALELNKPDSWDEEEYECVAFYGFAIRTDRGDLIIDYRNSSNGYYGGSLEWGDSYFYGGVYNQNVSNEDWQEVT